MLAARLVVISHRPGYFHHTGLSRLNPVDGQHDWSQDDCTLPAPPSRSGQVFSKTDGDSGGREKKKRAKPDFHRVSDLLWQTPQLWPVCEPEAWAAACPFASCFTISVGRKPASTFADSTKLSVCHNTGINCNRVFQGLSKRGCSTMGWFFGHLLHLLINDKGTTHGLPYHRWQQERPQTT